LRAAAEFYFGDRMDLAERYASLLATDGVLRGVIGPREAGRIWDRHLLNCAAIERALPHEAYVIDVGSGAGLPGIVLALVRPDIHVVLVEPLLRRTAFLSDILDRLGIGSRIDVIRGRAEEIAARPTMFHVKPADVVTVRAVAALDRLAAWCLPLLAVGGRLVAMKGMSASDEVTAHREAVTRAGGGDPTIHRYGDGTLPEPTVTIEVIRERGVAPTVSDGRRAERRGRRGR
jgi:16S rRNA (guanine527-N7)-methyltransferase